MNNDKRYPQDYVKHGNAKEDITMHALPKDGTVRKIWVQQILKGRKDLKSEKDIPNNCFVCSNHFLDGRPTKSNPSPSLLTVSTNTAPAPKYRKSPPKQKALPHKTENAKKKLGFFDGHFSTGQNEFIGAHNIESNSKTIEPGLDEINVDECEALPIPMSFAHITREPDGSTFTGIEGKAMFNGIFEMLKPKAKVMTYWDGKKRRYMA